MIKIFHFSVFSNISDPVSENLKGIIVVFLRLLLILKFCLLEYKSIKPPPPAPKIFPPVAPFLIAKSYNSSIFCWK